MINSNKIDLVFNSQNEFQSFVNEKNCTIVDGTTTKGVENERNYTRCNLLCPLSITEKAFQTSKAGLITPFLGAFSETPLRDISVLWEEAFKDKPLTVLTYFNLNDMPVDILAIIAANLKIKDIACFAGVCQNFNKVKNDPKIWTQLAALLNIPLKPDNKDIKGQVRDAVIKLDDGTIIDLRHKKITLARRNRLLDFDENQTSLKKAISYFGKNHYVANPLDSEFNRDQYIYIDENGTLQEKRVPTLWREPAHREAIENNERLLKTMTYVKIQLILCKNTDIKGDK